MARGAAKEEDMLLPMRRIAELPCIHNTLVGELFSLCEREVPNQSEPFHTGENKFRSSDGRDLGRKDLPPCTPVERGKLDHAGTVVKDFVDSIQMTDYKIQLR